MKLVEFLRDMSAWAFRLSRNTFDLNTSTELRKMGEKLKKQSDDRAEEIAVEQDKEEEKQPELKPESSSRRET